MPIWFLFDLGNTLIKLGYERVLENIRRNTTATRDQLIDILERPGGYRDMERGAVTFVEFYHFVVDAAGFRGSINELRSVWRDFFAAAVLRPDVAVLRELRLALNRQHAVLLAAVGIEASFVLVRRQHGRLGRRIERNAVDMRRELRQLHQLTRTIARVVRDLC